MNRRKRPTVSVEEAILNAVETQSEEHRRRGHGLSAETVTIWGDAILDVLVDHDNRQLAELILHGNQLTPDVRELLAWMLQPRKTGRPPLPLKFRLYKKQRHRLYDAVAEIGVRRANTIAGGRKPPSLEETAHGNEKLLVELRRSRRDPRRLV